MILTHVDTVWPLGKIEKMPFYVSGDKVFGPGVLDMKAGVVMAIFALKTLNELNIRPGKRIVVFINSAEEIGNDISHEVIRNLSKKMDYILCLEPALPGGALKTQRKGHLVVRLDALGKSAHASTPEKGVNAIEELLGQLHRMRQIKTKEVTVNIGRIGGGEKVNVVAENAWAVLDIRFWTSLQKESIIKFFRKMKPIYRGSRIKFSIESLTPPLEKSRASSDFLLRVKKIAAPLHLMLETGKTGGGSDACIPASMGIATLDGFGPDGDGIHSDHEHLLIPSLIQRTALLTEILCKL
jgi:glutamate carboxypeptidase